MPKELINILFLGGAKRVSLAQHFIKSGLERGWNVSIFSYELHADIPLSFIATIIIGKKWNDPDILVDLEAVINRENIQIVIPSVDPATIIASKLKKHLKSESFILATDDLKCEIFFHKQLTYNWAKLNGIPVPGDTLQFPMIAKPNNGSASSGIVKITNELEYEKFKKLNDISGYNIQQFINGREFSVDAYISIRNGNIVAIVPRERLEVLGGEAVKSITIRDEQLISLSKEIITKSGLTGPVTIQFIRDNETNSNYLMEINPRFGGAVLTSIGAGADFTGFVLDDFKGSQLKDQNESWKTGVMMIRYFSEFYRETLH